MAEPALDAELRELGRHLDVPPPPDLRAAVRARLTEPAPRGRRRQGPLLRVAAVVAALAVVFGAVVAASPRARAVIADFFHVGAIRVHSGPPPIPPSPAPRFAQLIPDTRTSTLAQARVRATFPLGVPAALGAPDEVLVGTQDRPSFVALRYAPGRGRPPAASSEIAVELDEVDGRLGPVADKFLNGGTAERVDVGGDTGYWISAPHELIYLDPSGEYRSETARLAERTLIWERGGVTYRLEGAFSRAQAIAVASSVR